MGRPRKAKHKGLPPNLYTTKRGGKTYFYYRHPATKKAHGMGGNRGEAIQAALQLNAMFMTPKQADLIARVTGGGDPLNDWLDRYVNGLEERELSPVTMHQRKWQVSVIRKTFGTLPVTDITPRMISEFLDKRPARTSNAFRSVFLDIFKRAKAAGLVKENPAESTLARRYRVKRQRLTLEEYKAIHAAGTDYLKRAMELSLLTLQRREDIAAMKFKDIQDGALHVVQQKTKQRIRIAITPQLEATIKRCRDNVVSPYLIHHNKGVLNAKPGAPLHIDRLSKAFAAAREKAGLYKGNESPPTFHEIRSLGARLYEEQGIDPQPLLGHKSRRMVDHYLDSRGVDWTQAEARLTIEF